MPLTSLTRLLNTFLFSLALLAGMSCMRENKTAEKPIIIDSIAAREKNPYSDTDQSPMDMSYFPVEYPLQKMNHTDSVGLAARVIYSRPHKKNRVIFGDNPQSLCPYGKEWRLGANEATEIEFFKNVTINGRNVSRGAYIIYCIPFRDKWTIVFNSNLHAWGLHMDTSKDLFRTDIPVMQQQPPIEDFTMVFHDAQYGADLIMAWDNVKAILPIEFSR